MLGFENPLCDDTQMYCTHQPQKLNVRSATQEHKRLLTLFNHGTFIGQYRSYEIICDTVCVCGFFLHSSSIQFSVGSLISWF